MRRFRDPGEMSTRARNTAAWRLRKRLREGGELSEIERRWAGRYDDRYADDPILAYLRTDAPPAADTPLVEDVPQLDAPPETVSPSPSTDSPAVASPSPQPAAPPPSEEPPPAPSPAGGGEPETEQGDDDPDDEDDGPEPERLSLTDLAAKMAEAEERGVDESEATALMDRVAALPKEELADELANAYEGWMAETGELAARVGMTPLPLVLVRGLLKPCARAAALELLPDDISSKAKWLAGAGAAYHYRLATRAERALAAQPTAQPKAKAKAEEKKDSFDLDAYLGGLPAD